MKLFFAILLGFTPPIAWTMPTDPVVVQENIHQTICTPGWAKAHRPPVYQTNIIKQLMMEAKGLDWMSRSDYELDHIISLELGGLPLARENLQLQPWIGFDGAYAKDRVENYLHRMVCSGKMKLEDAQTCLYTNWKECRK